MNRKKRLEVVGVVRSQEGSIGGVITDGKAKLPFVFNSAPRPLTGKSAQERLASGKWQEVKKPHRCVRRGRVIAFSATRLTVVCSLQTNDHFVICQRRRKDGLYAERFRQLDSLIGWWLEVGCKNPFVRANEDIVIPVTLASLIEAAKSARQKHMTGEFWGDMPLEQVMFHAMTGW